MEHSAGRIANARQTRGETLVETVVAFAVLLIMLTMVTTIVKSGIALNNRAIEDTIRLNADCADIELGTNLEPLMGENTLTLAYVYPEEPGQTGDIVIPLTVLRRGDGLISSFASRDVTPLPLGGQ